MPIFLFEYDITKIKTAIVYLNFVLKRKKPSDVKVVQQHLYLHGKHTCDYSYFVKDKGKRL